jgi:uncharacterized repeat protein (TIGR01451 family)
MPRDRAIATALVAAAIGFSAAASPPTAMRPPTPAATTPAPEPQLHIAVDDGRTSVAAGDRLTYTIKVHNIGSTDATQLEISQSLPAGLTFVSADHGGTAAAGRVSWTVDLKPGEESTLGSVGQVGTTPAELLRLATVACATEKDGGKPLVCSTHSDRLPTAAAPARTGGWPIALWSAGGVVVLGLVGSVLWRRRRRGRPSGTAGQHGPGASKAKTGALN